MQTGLTIKMNDLKTYVCLLLFIIPLIPLEGLYYINRLSYNFIYLFLMVVDVIVIAGCYFMHLCKTHKCEKITVIMLLMSIYNIALTAFLGGDLYGVVGVWVYSITMIFLIELYKERMRFFLYTVLFYLEVLLVLNLVLIALFPDGMYAGDALQYGKIWLFGYKSTLQCYVFPAVIVSLMFSAYNKCYKNTLFLLVISHIICLAASNSMLLMGLLFLDLIVFVRLYKKKFITKKIFYISICGIIFGNILIVGFTEAFLANQTVQYIIYSILGKNATLSMRTSNWAAVLPEILSSPFLGFGYTSSLTREVLYGRVTAHAHNIFLELLYENGLVGLLIFVLFNILIFNKLYKNYEKTSSRVIFCAIVVIYVMYIFENLFRKSSVLIWAIFALGYYCDKIDTIFLKEKGART